ncbi:DUF3048 C-terminal domain-containing protein [Streptomyces sp. NPDC097727]|uniref:DUF3048 C-terminal domain-containing protein n=1 Tax=Streptomyces sp. NPDC097727 TaxID=3366092 RepID=UPI00381B4712
MTDRRWWQWAASRSSDVRSGRRGRRHSICAPRPAAHCRTEQAPAATDVPAALPAGTPGAAPPPGGRPLAGDTVRYQAARSTFPWSADRHRWLVDMDGTPARTADGARLGAADVVVRYVTVRPSLCRERWGSTSPYTETVGSGSALVLRNGRGYEVGWPRRTAESGISFITRDGKQMTFAPGQVWIVFAPK